MKEEEVFELFGLFGMKDEDAIGRDGEEEDDEPKGFCETVPDLDLPLARGGVGGVCGFNDNVDRFGRFCR